MVLPSQSDLLNYAERRDIWQLPDECVASLANLGTLETWPPNVVVIREGERGSTLYVIIKGSVRVYRERDDGRQIELNVHGPGEHFGEMMLDHGMRTASVVTAEECVFSVLTRDQVERHLAGHPEISLAMLRMMMGRVRALTRTVGSLEMLDVYGRVAHVLLGMAIEDEGRLIIDHRLPVKEISEQVGAPVAMVAGILRDFRASGYMEAEGDEMVVLHQRSGEA